MKEIQEDLNVYSEEVRDILSHPPRSIFRWGNTILLGFFLIVLLLSWEIKYPDIITSQITITTQVPPEKLVAKSSGKIEKILVKDRTIVAKNTPLAIIENPANYKDVFMLKELLERIKPSVNNFEFPFGEIPALNLGAIEGVYALFEKDYLAYKLNKDLEPFQIDLSAQTIETVQLQERLKLLEEQKEIALKELQYKTKELDRNKNLHDKGVISTHEWEQKNVEYLQQEKNINSLNAQVSQIRSSLNDLNRNKKSTTVNQSMDDLQLYRNAVLSFHQLKQAIKEWELAYVLRSSIKGKVSFLKIWVENQTINSGENAFVIIPTAKTDFLGKIKAPALNSGKIQTGQKVNIRLANYPDREFGIIEGKVKSVSLTPDNENNLLIDVELSNGLKTSYNKDISFQQEMTGTADIITEDLRLIERLLYQFRDLIKRGS